MSSKKTSFLPFLTVVLVLLVVVSLMVYSFRLKRDSRTDNNSTLGVNSRALSNQYNVINNPFFPYDFPCNLKFRASFLGFSEEEYRSQDIVVEIRKIGLTSYGLLCKIVINSKGLEDVPAESLLVGYFLVRDNLIKYFVLDEGQTVNIDTLETFLQSSTDICSETLPRGITVRKDDADTHEEVFFDGEVSEFTTYKKTNDTNYYMAIKWERGKGLIGFKTGYGAESQSIKFGSYYDLD